MRAAFSRPSVRCAGLVAVTLATLAASALLPRAADAAGATGASTAAEAADTRAPVSAADPGAFPFLPPLEDFDAVPAAASAWTRTSDFARYVFQTGEENWLEIGGRLSIRHFAARQPGSQSLERIVESYRRLVDDKEGTTVHVGRFTGGLVDKQPRSEQQSREGATYLIRTPEREIWTQVSVRDDGDEYVLVVLEKGPLQLRTQKVTASALRQALADNGKAIVYLNFEFDKATLRPDAKPVLDEMFAMLRADPSLALSIEGHTDDRGPPDYNRALSERRAAAVRDALLARGLGGNGGARLGAAGRGAAAPIADNGSDEGRARNRRVELVRR